MDLIEQKDYYLMTEETHPFEIGKTHLETFEKYTFEGVRFFSSGHAVNVYLIYDFKNNENNISMYENEIEQKVFRSKDEVLKYLKTHIENLGLPYRLDSYIKKKILKSQERNPEVWI